MVSLAGIRTANSTAAVSLSNKDQTAVFVGATAGIGLAALQAFTSSISNPSIFIVGRSSKNFDSELQDLQQSNPNATIEFIEAEITLIREVDRVCELIKAKVEKIDKLWLSPGAMKLGGRDETSEGLHFPLALSYFSRLRFAYDLIPLLIESSDARVISILGGGLEEEIDVGDIEVKSNFGIMKAAKIAPTLTTLAFHELAKTYPSISFIHKYPGFVNSGAISKLLSSTPGVFSIPFTLLNYTLVPLLNIFVATTPSEAGERGLYLLTSPNFNAKGKDSDSSDGRSERHRIDGAVFLLSAKDEIVTKNEIVNRYIVGGEAETIWQETRRVWERCVNV